MADISNLRLRISPFLIHERLGRKEGTEGLKPTARREGVLLVQLHTEIAPKLRGGKTAGNASLQPGPSIPRFVHVPTYDDGFARLYVHRPARPSERLFSHVAMKEYSPIDKLSAGRHHFPPVCILITPGVGTPDRDRKAVRAGIATYGDLDRIRMVS